MKRHFVLWGGFRLTSSRLLPSLSIPQASVVDRCATEQQPSARVALLERELAQYGTGLGV
jgi:hypothetical protein